MRNSVQIDTKLGARAIVDGFVESPVYNYIKRGLWMNDINMYTCDFATAVDSPRWFSERAFESKLYLMNLLKP